MRAPVPQVRFYRLRRGLGNGQLLVPLPTYESCDPRDTACVERNQTLNVSYEDQLLQAQAQNNFNQCQENANNANSQTQFNQIMAACQGQAAAQNPGGQVVQIVPPAYPIPPAPPPVVVNPSPSTQPAATGSSTTSPASVTSVASGGTAAGTSLLSTVGGYVPSTTATTADWIAGIPNEYVVIGGAAVALLLMMGKR